jgi:hypothetical protein
MGPYQFRHMLKHVKTKPPIIKPEKMAAKLVPDIQAPMIPPMAMLASNERIHIVNVFTSGRFYDTLVAAA